MHRFPEGTRGFLYAHPTNHIILAHLRFRVLDQVPEDPGHFDFKAGHDVLLPSGLPWKASLPSLLVHSHSREDPTLARLLIDDGIFTAEDCDHLVQHQADFYEAKVAAVGLGDLFDIMLARHTHQIRLGHGKGLMRYCLRKMRPLLFEDVPYSRSRHMPFREYFSVDLEGRYGALTII
jgi:hypothetical protein